LNRNGWGGRMLRIVVALLCWAADADAECRLALALAMDVSRSVDATDFAIQTEGLALALEDAAVQRAILRGDGPVALAIFQWSGTTHQELLQDWRVIDGLDALDGVIRAVRAARRPQDRQLTALGEAMRFGLTLTERAPPCARMVLDMAGDGQGNEGIPVTTIRKRLDFSGLTVNGLAIGEHEQGLVTYFRDYVIGGPGAFVEVAPRQADYPRAIRRKLLRELQAPQIGMLATTQDPPG
jgi:hypothetical protein